MNKALIQVILFSCLYLTISAQQGISASEIITHSIEYHDPDGLLMSSDVSLYLNETRPDGSENKSTVSFDIRQESYAHQRKKEGATIISQLQKGVVSITLDGRSEYTEEEKEKYRINENRVEMMKNYYQYLWLLPMKLTDEGTLVDPKVETVDFFGKESIQLKVTYDPSVGKDIWYFYFHPQTYALQGYRFYHDESANDGEYILLEGETSYKNVRLPKSRKWYTHKEDKYLGDDILEKILIE